MPELRQDPTSGRWVIIAEGRSGRPQEFSAPASNPVSRCPFCAGNEALTPDEISAYPTGQPDAAWQVRVVPNMYPAVQWDTSVAGSHEVIVESPRHITSLTDLSEEHARLVFAVYQKRLRALGQDERLRYGLVFKNSGGNGGASLEHLHSQLLATEFVPPEIQLEAAKAGEYRVLNQRCLICDLLADELQGNRVVADDEHFVAFCPYASRFPYEMWVVPKTHEESFEKTNSDRVNALGALMLSLLKKLEACLGSCAYNYWIHTAPFRLSPHDDFHWHIEIAPRVSKLAGFELGGGCFINPVDPDRAADCLRNA